MKFLCLKCDEQMKLTATRRAGTGGESLTVIFGCPSCSYEVCMLANPWETQLVSSLGVKIGSPNEEEDRLSKCPFSGVVREMEMGVESPAGGPAWTEEAFVRLQNIPEFVRPMARQGIEMFARERGYHRIDDRVLDEAREKFGM